MFCTVRQKCMELQHWPCIWPVFSNASLWNCPADNASTKDGVYLMLKCKLQLITQPGTAFNSLPGCRSSYLCVAGDALGNFHTEWMLQLTISPKAFLRYLGRGLTSGISCVNADIRHVYRLTQTIINEWSACYPICYIATISNSIWYYTCAYMYVFWRRLWNRVQATMTDGY